jgi:hypothetical protein
MQFSALSAAAFSVVKVIHLPLPCCLIANLLCPCSILVCGTFVCAVVAPLLGLSRCCVSVHSQLETSSALLSEPPPNRPTHYIGSFGAKQFSRCFRCMHSQLETR